MDFVDEKLETIAARKSSQVVGAGEFIGVTQYFRGLFIAAGLVGPLRLHVGQRSVESGVRTLDL